MERDAGMRQDCPGRSILGFFFAADWNSSLCRGAALVLTLPQRAKDALPGSNHPCALYRKEKGNNFKFAALNSELSTLDCQLLTIASLLSAGEQTRYGDQQYGANRCRRQAEQETATEKAEPGEEPAAQQGPDQAEDHVGQTAEARAASDFARQPPGNQPDDNPAKQRLLHHRHSHFLLRKRFSFKGWNRRPSPGSVSYLLANCLPGFAADQKNGRRAFKQAVVASCSGACPAPAQDR